MVYGNSGLVTAGSSSGLYDHDSALNVLRAWSLKGCAEHEQSV